MSGGGSVINLSGGMVFRPGQPIMRVTPHRMFHAGSLKRIPGRSIPNIIAQALPAARAARQAASLSPNFLNVSYQLISSGESRVVVKLSPALIYEISRRAPICGGLEIEEQPRRLLDWFVTGPEGLVKIEKAIGEAMKDLETHRSGATRVIKRADSLGHLLCNAIDAILHLYNCQGNASYWGKINIVFSLSEEILQATIQDDGAGFSEEVAHDVFEKIIPSPKAADDIYIGYLGIGAHTFFLDLSKGFPAATIVLESVNLDSQGIRKTYDGKQWHLEEIKRAGEGTPSGTKITIAIPLKMTALPPGDSQANLRVPFNKGQSSFLGAASLGSQPISNMGTGSPAPVTPVPPAATP